MSDRSVARPDYSSNPALLTEAITRIHVACSEVAEDIHVRVPVRGQNGAVLYFRWRTLEDLEFDDDPGPYYAAVGIVVRAHLDGTVTGTTPPLCLGCLEDGHVTCQACVHCLDAGEEMDRAHGCDGSCACSKGWSRPRTDPDHDRFDFMRDCVEPLFAPSLRRN